MKKKVVKNIVNLIILFLGTEILKNFLIEMPELKNLDIGIIFVLIISNYMGMKYGIASAILASISYIIRQNGQIGDINVIFLNTNNWIPIVIYIVFSIIVGLKTDKENMEMMNLENEIEDKIKKEEETTKKVQKYETEVKELNQDLILHQNSYIQVAKFIKDLEENKNDISKINTILRKYIRNNTCELISCEELNKKTNSVFVGKFDLIEKEGIWINKELEESLPFYIAPIFTEGKERMVIVLWKCEFEQMNTEYRNQIIGISQIIKYIFEKM